MVDFIREENAQPIPLTAIPNGAGGLSAMERAKTIADRATSATLKDDEWYKGLKVTTLNHELVVTNTYFENKGKPFITLDSKFLAMLEDEFQQRSPKKAAESFRVDMINILSPDDDPRDRGEARDLLTSHLSLAQTKYKWGLSALDLYQNGNTTQKGRTRCLDEAISSLEAAVRQHPHMVLAMKELITAYEEKYGSKRTEGAAPKYLKFVDNLKERVARIEAALPEIKKGDEAVEAGKLDDALKCYETAIGIYRDCVSFYLLKSDVYQDMATKLQVDSTKPWKERHVLANYNNQAVFEQATKWYQAERSALKEAAKRSLGFDKDEKDTTGFIMEYIQKRLKTLESMIGPDSPTNND